MLTIKLKEKRRQKNNFLFARCNRPANYMSTMFQSKSILLFVVIIVDLNHLFLQEIFLILGIKEKIREQKINYPHVLFLVSLFSYSSVLNDLRARDNTENRIGI